MITHYLNTREKLIKTIIKIKRIEFKRILIKYYIIFFS